MGTEYELKPIGEPVPHGTRPRKYRDILLEFLVGPHEAVRVVWEGKSKQAIYMGLRAAKKANPTFALIDIKRENDGVVLRRIERTEMPVEDWIEALEPPSGKD